MVPEPMERAGISTPSRPGKRTRGGRVKPGRRSCVLPCCQMELTPADLAPMLPVLVEALPTGPGWVFELKWDGVRVLALRVGGRVELWSRRGRRVTRQYPE